MTRQPITPIRAETANELKRIAPENKAPSQRHSLSSTLNEASSSGPKVPPPPAMVHRPAPPTRSFELCPAAALRS